MGDSPTADAPVVTRRLVIAGMSGPNCVGRVERALKEIPGVANAIANLDRGEAFIRVAESVPLSMIAGVLDQTGYRLHAVADEREPEPEPQPEPAAPPAAPPPPPPVTTQEVRPVEEIKEPRSWIPSLRTIGRAVAYLFFLSIVWMLLYRVLPVPATPYMISEATIGGQSLHYEWVPLERISPNLVRSVIASEDGAFCSHYGFDFDEIRRSWKDAQRHGDAPRGASTISQQTAKNAFLWIGRSYIRKGVETYFTAGIELLWPKRRIMEVYLNIIEFGPGIFGAEAASRRWFGKHAANLTAMEAARLAAVLPSPKRYRANPPGPYIADRGYTIAARAATVGAYGEDSCARR